MKNKFVIQSDSTTPQILKLDDFSLEESAKSSFPWDLQGKVVQARGFWYPISSQEGILAPQPDLKSCCLKAPIKIQQQLLVKGALDSLTAQRVITLQGLFRIDPQYNSEGQLTQLFILEQAKEVSQSSSHFSPILAGLFIVFLCVIFFVFKRKFRRLLKK